MLVTVRVIPRAARNELAGLRGDAVVVRLTAAPVDGAANHALIRLLARTCDVPTSAITVLTGEHARQKTLRIAGRVRELVAARLGVSAGSGSEPTSVPSVKLLRRRKKS